ncbi:Shugoshin [Neofusicoccum parvum]|nr:Shugoshin [Neofusicoccum parvum]
MARLNEAPPPAESVDQLKRRFIRQNRELAKNNSAQSVRIRALETEQARLLAENLSLREQIIQLQTELEHNKGHNAVRQITSVKDKLESKLLEIGGLVAELNSIHKPSSKARLSEAAPSRATEHFEWRRAMKEQAGEQDDDEILPTIREDKYFPRRTLDTEELRAVLTDAAEESPDLGPPPVAHFTDEDPIKFDPKPAIEDENDDMEVDQKDEEPLPATLSVNLETRKKRRDSSKLDLRKMSVFQSPGEDDTARASESEDSQPSKMGKKRKLSATAEDTNGEAGEKDYRDDFRFSRRSGDRDNRQPLETSHKQNTKLDPTMAAERKALGDKTNTSPKKVQKSDSKSDPKSGIKKLEFPKETARNRVRERKSRSSMVKIAPAETNGIVETVDVEIEEPEQPEQPELPPKTPAGLDLFSPASTEPSAARQESRDTPPPGDLGSSNSDATAGGRPSRRARSQVNYAEPSLSPLSRSSA